MSREEALRVLNNAKGSDRVAQILSLDPGVMIDVMLALNPRAGIVDVAKWHHRMTEVEEVL